MLFLILLLVLSPVLLPAVISLWHAVSDGVAGHRN